MHDRSYQGAEGKPDAEAISLSGAFSSAASSTATYANAAKLIKELWSLVSFIQDIMLNIHIGI